MESGVRPTKRAGRQHPLRAAPHEIQHHALIGRPGGRDVYKRQGCDRCGAVWGMHDRTRTFVPWDSELEAMYAPGGPLDPETYKG